MRKTQSKLQKTRKAYDNSSFLHSDTARGLRILSEYLEPEQRLRRLNINNGVIFFGSARTVPGGRPDYYAAAANLAERIAQWTLRSHAPRDRYYIVTGGGPGIMQAAHEGAARVNRALNIGLNISLPFEQHLNPCVKPNHAFEFHYFFMRKFWFLNLARAAVIFPGGFGTMDELFELLTLTQTGKSSAMPILLYGRAYWERTVNFKSLAQAGLISREDRKLFRIVNSVDEACAALGSGLCGDAGAVSAVKSATR
ncbi:MAG TPA: LOG family protein [Stenotrophobium sp.]|nr:LOG family protein [Stenotrophobium sp.]